MREKIETSKEGARRRYLKYLILLISLIVISVAILQRFDIVGRYTHFEGQQVSKLLNIVGISSISQGPFVIIPLRGGGIVRGCITFSCSSLGVIVVFLILSILTPWLPLKRKFGTALIAVPILYAGNILRLFIIFFFGHFYGVAVLVSLHNWLGPVLSFVYLLVAYTTWLYFLIRKRRGIHW